MSELIAVCMFPAVTPDRSLKREALLFDRIELFGLSKLLEIVRTWNQTDVFREWEYLKESGFLADPQIQFIVPREETAKPPGPIPASPAEAIAGVGPEDARRMAATKFEMEAFCRDYAGRVRTDGIADAVYLGVRTASSSPPATGARDAVLKVVLRQLPLPNEATPWEAIRDFRADSHSVSKYRALRHWINGVATGSRPAIEAEEELLYLMDEYRAALKVHHLKTATSIVETLVTTSAEILGNLASFQWGKAAKAVFDLRDADLKLREAERSAPGREVAFLVDAAKRFG